MHNTVPSADSFSVDIKKKFSEDKQALKMKLADSISNINFTCDLWTSSYPKSFFGVTAHFLNNNFEIGIYLFIYF